MDKYAAMEVPAPPQPPMVRLYSAVERLSKVASSVGSISDRLCGSYPAAGGMATQEPSGIFDEIDALASQINSIADSISDATGRISDRL